MNEVYYDEKADRTFWLQGSMKRYISEKPQAFKYKKLQTAAFHPTKENGDIGWDLRCLEDENFRNYFTELGQINTREKILELSPGSRYTFSTGLAIELPLGYNGILKPRSGLAVKNGVCVLAGVIDNGYRGEVKICLLNTSARTIRIDIGDKIAQMIIVKECKGQFIEADELNDTSRGEKGFGSTGK